MQTKTFFGHPRGLATLFFTEMWERFSYYGMRGILYLFLLASVESGGMGYNDETGGAIYGLYTMFVYLLALPGGWLADNFFGLRKAVFIGGCLIAFGHFLLFIPTPETFYAGLVTVVMGVGLLKPNISGIVGGLYKADEQSKRDAGFSLFYTGINLGAFIAPLIVGPIGERISWNLGFGVAGIGMLIGLVQYKMTEKYLGDVGLEPTKLSDPALQSKREKTIKMVLWSFGFFLISLMMLVYTGMVTVNPVAIAEASGIVILVFVTGYFAYIFLFEKLTIEEKKKISVVGILFLFAALFWSGFEQAGSTLNIFAARYTDRVIFGIDIPASVFQSVNSIFIIVLSPVFAWLWVWLANKNINPSTPLKFSFGLIFLGLGFAIMAAASYVVAGGANPLFTWLLATYFLHTVGELSLSPVGLSAMTKLAPQRMVGQMMGIWFMSTALGNLFAGRIAGNFSEEAINADPGLMPDLFWLIVKTTVISGLVLLIFSKPIRKLMGNIR
ncbi:MAG: peptide MFS transporter [Cytophagales bacterium]|nr:peptide MFS transporter [Cytophagales bacterium]